MTDTSNFTQAYSAFMATVYPAYPRWTELQDWNSHLLTIDGHIAGYASQVSAGSMQARDIPELDKLVRHVRALRVTLSSIKGENDQDAQLVSEYRTYVSALESLVVQLSRLAREI